MMCSSRDVESYEGRDLSRLEDWLIEVGTDKHLGAFFNEVSDLLDHFQMEDPGYHEWHFARDWDDFIDACYDLSTRVEAFLKEEKLLKDGETVHFPKISDKLVYWWEPEQYL